MTTRLASTLSATDTAIGRRVTLTGVLIGLIPVAGRVHVTVLLPGDAEVDIHPKDRA